MKLKIILFLLLAASARGDLTGQVYNLSSTQQTYSVLSMPFIESNRWLTAEDRAEFRKLLLDYSKCGWRMPHVEQDILFQAKLRALDRALDAVPLTVTVTNYVTNTITVYTNYPQPPTPSTPWKYFPLPPSSYYIVTTYCGNVEAEAIDTNNYYPTFTPVITTTEVDTTRFRNVEGGRE